MAARFLSNILTYIAAFLIGRIVGMGLRWFSDYMWNKMKGKE